MATKQSILRVSDELLGSSIGCSPAEARQVIEELVAHGLFEQVGDEEYRLTEDYYDYLFGKERQLIS